MGISLVHMVLYAMLSDDKEENCAQTALKAGMRTFIVVAGPGALQDGV